MFFHNYIIFHKCTECLLSSNSYEEPDSWGIDVCANINNGPWTCDILAEKSTDSYSGTYAIKVKNTAINTGTVASASPNSNLYGIPFTGQPSHISFYLKTSLLGDDFLEVRATTIDQSFNAYLQALTTITTVYSSYTQIKVPMNQVGSFTGPAESIYIDFSIKTSSTANPNSYVLVDEIGFDYLVSTQETQKNAFSMYPNPVTNTLNFSSVVDYKIVSTSGAVVLSGSASLVNTSALSSGTYYFQATKSNGVIVNEKLVKI